jgi:hypothetical protein
MATRNEYEAAKEDASHAPHAVAVRYDRQADRIVVTLNTRVDLSFSPRDAQGLENANAEQLAVVEITPPGFGLHWPKLDADLYVPALLGGILGSRRWMAARLGAAGGRSRSKAKAAASRKNGKLGGRPAKKPRPASRTASGRRNKQQRGASHSGGRG